MCKCTPEIRTPYCGKFGCEWPGVIFNKEDLVVQEWGNKPPHVTVVNWKKWDHMDHTNPDVFNDARNAVAKEYGGAGEEYPFKDGADWALRWVLNECQVVKDLAEGIERLGHQGYDTNHCFSCQALDKLRVFKEELK